MHNRAIISIKKGLYMNQGALMSPNRRPVWHGLAPDRTAAIVPKSYGERAGEEVLFRALLAERDMDIARAEFWLDVYAELRLGHRD